MENSPENTRGYTYIFTVYRLAPFPTMLSYLPDKSAVVSLFTCDFCTSTVT